MKQDHVHAALLREVHRSESAVKVGPQACQRRNQRSMRLRKYVPKKYLGGLFTV
jgi:hypothetical protein